MIVALAIVATWSAAEVAIFFLVADIPISWVAVTRGTRAAVIAALVAALASIAGTLAVLLWAGADPDGAARTMADLPGIDAALVTDAANRFRHGPLAVLAGAFSGIPFKLFALEAARQEALGFLLLAPLLRLPRFLAVALLVGAISKQLSRWMSVRQRLALLLALWVAFYALYFTVMPG
jgi:hypothetical protein